MPRYGRRMNEDESTVITPLPRRERRRAWARLRAGAQGVRRVGAGALIVLVGAGAVAAGAASAALGDAGVSVEPAADSVAENASGGGNSGDSDREEPPGAAEEDALGERSAVSSAESSAAESSGVPGDGASGTDATAGEIVVHVIGAVMRPGTVRLREGARVQDAIAAVGGGAEGADPASVNLARPLQDGEQLVLARIGEHPVAASAGESPGAVRPGAESGGGGVTGMVRLNTATASELESLPGVGAATAEKILRWREEHGGFRAVADLLEIPGIGPRRFAELEDRVQL